MAVDETNKKSTIREYYEALLIAVIFVNFARIFAFQAFKIPTGSMEDNLKVGDHIIVNKFIYGPGTTLGGMLPLREIRRGDIIVFRYPLQPDTDFVKRVVGLPGDTVEVHDKVVWVNGKPLAEPYVIHVDPTIYPPRPQLPEPYRSRDQFGPYFVPEGQYFAMGDNRDRSSDSRYWGTVPRSMIKGKAFMVYWSFEGTPPSPDAPSSARFKELAGVLVHFFTKTRWERTFFIVDSKYHFTPGLTPEGEAGESP
ncbi:MAG TPA: signal peptidase I [Thermoanaerobaculia bacterium]|jgi:signal peptidase I|nr:signal peptidase I [Thermoanaerobaculia bacterium]